MSVTSLTTNETESYASVSTLSFPNSSESEYTYNTNPTVTTSSVVSSISTFVFPSENGSTLNVISEDNSISTLVFPSEDGSNSDHNFKVSTNNSISTLVFPSEDGSNSDHNFEVSFNNLILMSAFDDYESDLIDYDINMKTVQSFDQFDLNLSDETMLGLSLLRKNMVSKSKIDDNDNDNDIVNDYDNNDDNSTISFQKKGVFKFGHHKTASNTMDSFDSYGFKADSEDDKKRKKLLKLKTNTPFVHSGRMGIQDFLNSHTFEDAINIKKESKSVYETNIKFLNMSNSKIDDNSTISSITHSSTLVSNALLSLTFRNLKLHNINLLIDEDEKRKKLLKLKASTQFPK